jgi:hypothetical protein
VILLVFKFSDLFMLCYIIIEPDENEKPRVEVQSDMKKVENEFAQLRDQ